MTFITPQVTTPHATICKFCHKPIVIEIDSSYAELGDVFKLLPFAACNRCADLRVRRRKLEHSIALVCKQLMSATPTGKARMESEARRSLEGLTRAYAKMVCDWLEASHPAWDMACVDLIIDKPDCWAQCLRQLWKMYRDTNTLPSAH